MDFIPETADVVIVGTGAAAFAGAITAAHAGLSVLMLEKTEAWGGTSAYSGGGVWIPDNPHVREHGLPDSYAIARDYLDRVVGDAGPATSDARKHAFLSRGPEMVQLFRDLGMNWAFKTNIPDYYPQLPGAGRGRGLGCAAFDGRRLGPALATMRKPVNYPPLVFSGSDMPALLAPFRRAGNFIKLARILAVSLAWKIAGKVPLSMGRATMGELMLLAQKLGIEMLLDADMRSLVTTDGGVSGVRFLHEGSEKTIFARRAVLIAAGGFARNDEYRRRFQPVGAEHSAAAPGDTGGAIAAAAGIGAALALMDESWWMPVMLLPDGSRSITLWERAMPHSIIVDRAGERYMNEALPYDDCGRLILERGGGDHSWLIIDSRHRRNYAFATLPARYTPRKWLDSGFFIQSDSISGLAAKLEMDGSRLHATIDRFNLFARSGDDADFGRGGSVYDNAWGDADHKPNPNLGTLEQPPFYAVRVWPGDIGTKGGLLTDENGQVLSEAGEAIPGLYAAGNSTASVMGRSYPGPGGTLGPAMVFAYAAMLHAAASPAQPLLRESAGTIAVAG